MTATAAIQENTSSFDQLKSSIVDTVKKAQKGQVSYETLYQSASAVSGKHEFLFFIKPELTLESGIDFAAVVDTVFEKIAAFGLNIQNVKVIGADYLKQNQIIDQHYGQINKIAKNAKQAMSDGAKDKFKQSFGVSVDDANVMGGFEFLDKFPFFNATSEEYLWQNKTNTKLAGGTYCAEVKMDADQVYLINGFHPYQILHFVAPGRSIVTFTLSSDISWADARQKFIGATRPNEAEAGSLRNTFYLKKEELGIPEVSQAINGVHLSAGPIEGLIELMRYNSDYANGVTQKPSDYAFGCALASQFSDADVQKILSNITVMVDGKNTPLFDLTEEKDADAAIQILKSVL